MFSRVALLFLSVLVSALSHAQIINGVVKDKQSDEPIQFAGVRFTNAKYGVLTDSAGNFSISILKEKLPDTLEIISVSYITLKIPIDSLKNETNYFELKLEVAKPETEVVVKAKYSRSLWFWRKVMANKHKYDRSDVNSYSYEIYNKLEIDLNNINKEKLSKNKLLRPFDFVLDNVDSVSEKKPFLPIFLTETLSDFYFQRSPKKTKEIIKAARTNGIGNESVTKLLGGMYQNVNVYNNYIPVFDKQFISPFHENGDNYYNFKLADTQYLGGRRLVHFLFSPKRKGFNTFDGDCWVNDTSFAIQKITLRPSGESNINYIENLSVIQEYRLINDSLWFLYKDKFVADVAPIGKSRMGLKGRKTATYKEVLINNDSIRNVLALNKVSEEVKVLPNSEKYVDSFWQENRHEQLSNTEQGIYDMIDSIYKTPAFKKYNNTITFLATGYKQIGNYEIGPWYNWISGNSWEGTRVRFDLGTNPKFNRKIYLHGYLAYGFTDQKVKGKAEIFYLPKKSPRTFLAASYTKDLDNGQTYYDEISTDNIFALAIRKNNVPLKFLRVEEKKIQAFHETPMGLSFLLTTTSKKFDPLRNLPDKQFFANAKNEILNNFETSLRVRFAYLERFLEGNFYRTSLGSDYPIAEVKLSKGFSGVLGSSYDYSKISMSVSDYVKTPPYGNIYWNVFGGRVFGTLPFPMLEIHPGNEIYYYNKYAFNLMNRFEYISDKYAGFNLEHNIGNGLFRFIPITRKLKFRQFWSAKGVVGGLSKANQALNFQGDHQFKTLNKKMYVELGTGVDNIFKVLRFDFIWRVAPQEAMKQKSKNFGVFGSFRLTF